jgi:hypothetical protein
LALTVTIARLGQVGFAAEPTQSSPIALSSDDRLLINVNPDSNSITLFDVTTETPRNLKEIKGRP